ncbi:M23 family metallopeptidase [Alphaproteobacteria bacterium]|nr:M23 family metallopeptidase [Alphaproteobacteria bacterium]
MLIKIIFISTVFAFTIIFNNSGIANDENLYKSHYNEEALKGVLQGAGLSLKESNLATKVFKTVYPPEMLTESSYLILPFSEDSLDSFAINIDGSDAVLIIKVKNDFKAFITSTKYAHKAVEKGINDYKDNKDFLEINEYYKKEVKGNISIINENFIFNKGDTLLNFLYVPGSNRKEISSAIKSFSSQFNPLKIKAGTNGKIIRTNKGKVICFYIIKSKAKTILTYLSAMGYESITVPTKNIDEIINKNIHLYIQEEKKFNITRISLLNAPHLNKKKIKIIKGGNLFNTLIKEGIESKQIVNLLDSLIKIYDPKRIRPEQEIILAFDKKNLYGLSIASNQLREIQVVNTQFGFKEFVFIRPVKKIFELKKIVIENSLYLDSINAKLPDEVLSDMVRLFSYSIDFQRDIRKQNIFKVYYEVLLNYKGEVIMPGKIIYANAKIINNYIEMFRFESQLGDQKYFNSQGKSIRKTLMKTPIDGARLSSRFGKRRHPVLGYTKMHKGIDFAAKTGTPIFAAGDGIIERANVYGGYGKYIRIRHNSKYKTAYAHLHKFAKNIKRGRSVRQGQIIGYVGSTGRSTGPHLHYEILVNNKQVNPQKLKLPEGRKLENEELKDFTIIKKSIMQKIAEFNL